jgi:ribonuclease HI
MDQLIIYTDGGARGNPGIAGAGAVLQTVGGEVLKKVSQPLGHTTNNEAEYRGVLLGLETAKKLFGKEKLASTQVEIRLDSELVCRQLSGQYQIKEASLFPWFIKVWNLRVTDFPKLTFKHIPREQNAIADGLANEAMDQQA